MLCVGVYVCVYVRVRVCVCVCVYGALIQLYWCLFLVLSMDFYVCTM